MFDYKVIVYNGVQCDGDILSALHTTLKITQHQNMNMIPDLLAYGTEQLPKSAEVSTHKILILGHKFQLPDSLL
jgi:hypothetical protein